MRGKVLLFYIILQITGILQISMASGVETGFRERDTFFKGMMKDELFEAYKGKCQLLCFQKILDKERIILRDTSLKSSNNIITFELSNGRVTKWEEKYCPYGLNNNKDASNEIKLIDWHTLGRKQQMSFLLEYLDEINNRFGTNITIDIDRYISAMDYYANCCNINSTSIPATEAVNTLLINDGKAKKC